MMIYFFEVVAEIKGFMWNGYLDLVLDIIILMYLNNLNYIIVGSDAKQYFIITFASFQYKIIWHIVRPEGQLA